MEPTILAILKPDGTLGAIPVRDLEKAKEVAKHKTLVVAGTRCEIKGLVTEQEFEGLKIFWTSSARDKFKQNMEYLRKYKHWPKV